jgi:hypothetical protein
VGGEAALAGGDMRAMRQASRRPVSTGVLERASTATSGSQLADLRIEEGLVADALAAAGEARAGQSDH